VSEREVLEHLRRFEIETHLREFGNREARSHVYPRHGATPNVHERIADATLARQLTVCATRHTTDAVGSRR